MPLYPVPRAPSPLASRWSKATKTSDKSWAPLFFKTSLERDSQPLNKKSLPSSPETSFSKSRSAKDEKSVSRSSLKPKRKIRERMTICRDSMNSLKCKKLKI